MASNISGIGSNIDFGAIRDSIIASRSKPIAQLQTKSSTYTNRAGALKSLNTALAALTTASEALSNKSMGSNRSLSSSDATILTASGTSEASLGQFDVSITRLATNLSQASRSYSSVNDTILVSPATTATFELRKGGESSSTKTITIDSTNNTLTGLRDAINNADAGVTATIVDLNGRGTAQQLVLSSKESGAAGRIELVETTATGTGADLGIRNLNPVDGDFTKLDAALTVGGLEITRSSNTISDAITGITLNLKKAGSVNVQVNNSNDIKNKLDAFINAYNNVQDFVAGQYQKDAKGKPTGILVGDTALSSVQQKLREVVSQTASATGSSFDNLAEIGIGRDESGHLTLDATVFADKLKTSFDDVKALLVGKEESQTGIAQSIHTASSSLSDTVTGTVQIAIKGYEDSVKSMTTTITSKVEALNRYRDSLTKQFAAADAAIGSLNSANSSLTNLLKTLQSNSSSS